VDQTELRIKHFYGTSENAVKRNLDGGLRLCARRIIKRELAAERLAQYFSTDFVSPLIRKNRAFRAFQDVDTENPSRNPITS